MDGPALLEARAEIEPVEESLAAALPGLEEMLDRFSGRWPRGTSAGAEPARSSRGRDFRGRPRSVRDAAAKVRFLNDEQNRTAPAHRQPGELARRTQTLTTVTRMSSPRRYPHC